MSDPAPRKPAAQQLVFDDLDTPLFDTTFVVVDLETTGTSPGGDAITEIGAVKVRGGEVLGEFATLVNPGRAVPPAIVQVTGITTAMVYAAPSIASVLPGFLEFASGAVLVAHNARFDMAFLKAAAAAHDMAWPVATVLCTVKLARRVLGRDEAPSVRLSALAQLLGASTQPTHRALDDARATVDVLHALIARVGNQGVHSLTELVDYLPDVTPRQRAKRVLAADMPASPGVYLFRGPAEEVLYIGTAVNLRRRVRNYFTGSETRGRMKEMVALATRVDHVVCAHALEAGVRELRLLVAHTPPYNRRSKFPKRAWWITLTDEPFPRFSIVRTPNRDALGPFNSRADATELAVIIAEYTGLRTCSTRLPRHGSHECPPAIVGGCPAAASGTPINTEEYAPAPALVRALFAGYSDTPLRTMLDRIETHSRAEHFEAAARLRDRTVAVVRALHRTQRLTAIARIAELIAAHPDGAGGWEFAVIRYGRLAGAGNAARGVPPMAVVEQIVASAETVIPEGGVSAQVQIAADVRIPPSTPRSPVPATDVRLVANAVHDQEEIVVASPERRPAQVPHDLERGPVGNSGTVPRDPHSTVTGGDAAGFSAAGGVAADELSAGEVAAQDWVPVNVPPLRGASPEEAALVVRWLARAGVRIVRTTEGYREPIYGAGRWLGWAEVADAAAHHQPAGEAYVERLG
ncbi:DEDD exonuclease domain-containing protein [Nocardia sp. NPDC060256]|uniref:DEDD exonuclease domain-containing protein n=1 Tax=unclassified Nocardia TaxID=2637762 RepID=UPI003647844F